MRKLVILAVLAGVVPAAHADVGLGLFVGRPSGLDLKLGLAPRSGIDIVLGWDTFRDGRDYYAHVTYLATLVVGRGESVIVPLRLGIGAAVYGPDPEVAIRAPLEIGFRFRSAPVELYGEIAARLEVADRPPDPHFYLDGGIGFRIYF
jgi:hypothetical protein